MCPVVDNPASCKNRVTFIMNAVEIDCEFCAVYSPNVTEGTIRQRGYWFKDGQTNVRDEERRARPSLVSHDFLQSIEKQNFCVNFLKLQVVLYRIIIGILGCHKFCTTLVLKILTGGHKTQNGFGFDFFFFFWNDATKMAINFSIRLYR
jgi:hypothetical protein